LIDHIFVHRSVVFSRNLLNNLDCCCCESY